MVVIWSEQSRDDLKSYAQNSKILTEGKVSAYLEALVDYTNLLKFSICSYGIELTGVKSPECEKI